MTESELNKRINKGESFLLAADGQYLGRLSSNHYLFDGIMNEYGSYGSKYSSTSIFNNYCRYGSQYSNLSPFNLFTPSPPKIYYKGIFVGYLSINQLVSPRIDPHQIFDYIINNGL